MSKVILITAFWRKKYIGARSLAAGREAAEKLKKENLDVKFVPLDVTNIETIKAAKETIEKNDGRLDVLVNNAAISGKTQNASTADVSAIRDCVEVNLIGLVQTTTTFLPLLRASPQAVILNVSSGLASDTWLASNAPLLQAISYSTSKTAANSYTIALAQELKKEGIKVNAATPGVTSTKLNNYHPAGKTARQGAECLLPWALIDKDGPTCQFFL